MLDVDGVLGLRLAHPTRLPDATPRELTLQIAEVGFHATNLIEELASMNVETLLAVDPIQ